MLLAVVLWGVLFDGTHVMGTYARTYWAPDEDSRASLPGGWSWTLLAVGPALAWWDAGFQAFLVVAYLWAYHHLVKQHWGFVALYRRRDRGSAGREWLDRALLWTVALHPYVRYALGPAYATSGLPVLLPPEVSLRPAPRRGRARARDPGGAAGGRDERLAPGRAAPRTAAPADPHRGPRSTPRSSRASAIRC